MEAALSLWIEDFWRKNIALDSNIICEKAQSLYSCFAPEAHGEPRLGTSSENLQSATSFHASQVWFDCFRKQVSLKNVRLSEEVASANHMATAEFKRLIKEKGYRPEQVFTLFIADVLEEDAGQDLHHTAGSTSHRV